MNVWPPTIRIETGHDMNVRVADNVPHSLVCVEVLQEIGCQGEHQLAPHHLISMHVSNQLQHGLQEDTFTLRRNNSQNQSELTSSDLMD